MKVCIDRVLPAQRFKPLAILPSITDIFKTRLVAPLRKQWINGTVLRVRFIGGTEEQQAIVRREAGWWMECCNITFNFNNAPDAEIRITFDENDGAWSYIGTDCASIPLDQPTMNLGFLDEGTAAHEFGHALGLGHEHQNPQGGINWNRTKVIADLSGPPNWWDEDTIQHNVLDKYSLSQIKGTAFDSGSIMLYWFPAEWTTNGIGTTQNNKLSSVDRSYIGSPAMYPKPTPVIPEVPAKVLKLNATRRTEASIRRPGEEDLFTFKAEKTGRYTIDTRGNTNVAMRLFGPNSKTLLVAEDDDSGLDANAKISLDLAPGDYFVQVRHADQANGTGKYTVKCFYKTK